MVNFGINFFDAFSKEGYFAKVRTLNFIQMKKQKNSEKKLSLKKLQVTKLIRIRGGNGDNDTVLDNTDTKSSIKCKTDGIDN